MCICAHSFLLLLRLRCASSWGFIRILPHIMNTFYSSMRQLLLQYYDACLFHICWLVIWQQIVEYTNAIFLLHHPKQFSWFSVQIQLKQPSSTKFVPCHKIARSCPLQACSTININVYGCGRPSYVRSARKPWRKKLWHPKPWSMEPNWKP